MKTLHAAVLALALLAALLTGCATTTTEWPPEAREAFDKGNTAMQDNDPVHAMALYEEALKLAPDRAEIWQEQGMAQRVTGHLQRAARSTMRAIQLDPANADRYVNLVNVYLEARKFENAYALVEAMERSDMWLDSGTASGLMLGVGFNAMSSGDLPTAERAIAHALELDPSNMMALVDYGALLAMLGDTDTARTCIERGLIGSSDEQVRSLASGLLDRLDKRQSLAPVNLMPTQALPARFLSPHFKDPDAVLALAVDEQVTKVFPVPLAGDFSLTVPEGWHGMVVKNPPGDAPRGAYTISFFPDDKTRFTIVVTVVPQSAPPADRPEGLRRDAEKMADELERRSVEASVDLREISNDHVRGWWYFLTDKTCLGKTPNEEDYLYALQGLFACGRSRIVASAFMWVDDEALRQDVVRMFSSFSIEERYQPETPTRHRR